MHILFDLLHLVAAAVLSLAGFGYEREEDCDPVRFQPSAFVEEAAPASGTGAELQPEPVADCETARARLTFPAL
ncbi:MAG: hypothetical protein ABL308_00170 [Oceanicaulis sp.]